MNTTVLKESVLNGKFDGMLGKLYPDAAAAKERYAAACDKFLENFGERDEVRLFSAPGRTEVGGNHTDHQHGRVLAGSVNLDVIAVVSPNGTDKINFLSEGYKMVSLSVNDMAANADEYGTTVALIRGCCAYIRQSGYDIKGFDAYATSNVLRGSGLSSSAAFEVLVCNILNNLYCDGKIDPVEIAKISQKSERSYFGKPCGLLDQMACSMGGFTAIDFKNPEIPVVENISFDLAEKGYVLCVVDTHGDHADLTDDYADITVECKEISNFLGKDFLRDVDQNEFYKKLGEIRAEFGDRSALRAIHFFNEDARAEEEKLALKQDNFEHFLDLVNESGDSSFKYLQNVYSTSNVKSQGLSLALCITEQFLKGEGACRVHGGGFAGTIQCYIPADRIEDYRKVIDGVFGEGSCCVLSIRPIGGCEIC